MCSTRRTLGPPEPATPEARPRRRRRWWWLAAVATVAIVMAAPSAVLNPVATWLVRGQLGSCVEADGVEVDVGAWPAVVRSIIGGLHGASFEAERVSVVGLTARRVSARFDRLAPLRLGGIDPLEVHGGELAATLTQRDLAAALPSSLLTVEVLPSGVVLDAPLAPTVVVDLRAEAGDLVLRPRLAGIELVTARIAIPEPARLRDIRLATGRLELSATMDGEVELDRFGC